MSIYNLGSINADYFYEVPHLPKPGETLAATKSYRGLGGKGANQSIAAARAGGQVIHIGAIGPDGDWAVRQLQDFGVDVSNVAKLDIPTAHAIINVDPKGENAIVIFSSANVALEKARVDAVLAGAQAGDYCLLQNETNLVAYTAQKAQSCGLKVIYSAAPFDAKAAAEVLPHVDLLVVNEIEAEQLSAALDLDIDALPVAEILITKGADGAVYKNKAESIRTPAFNVTPVDTTGAGDTYLGYFVAGLDQGLSVAGAMRRAAAAAAIQVTRKGTADAIPEVSEVAEFLVGQKD